MPCSYEKTSAPVFHWLSLTEKNNVRISKTEQKSTTKSQILLVKVSPPGQNIDMIRIT